MNPKVNIILATYNGERYIKEQLDSICNQTYSNIDIYIRDDGSSDNTLSVIKDYQKRCTKKIYILDNDGINLKCPGSFYEIIKQCKPADYYALCDQDDIWYKEKIRWAVERLEKEEKRIPLVYYTACDYSTVDGKIIRKSPVQREDLKLYNVLYYTPGSGFTMVFNERAREDFILNVEPGPELHDRWLARCAVCFGKLIYDRRCSASHIRHEEAVTSGDAGNISLISNFIKRELCGADTKYEKKALGYFRNTFDEKLTDDQIKTLELFCEKNNIIRWFRKVFYGKRLRARLSGEIALRILFFIGKI